MPSSPTADENIDVARVVLHRASAVVRAGVVGATDLDPPADTTDPSAPPGADPAPASASARAHEGGADHRALLEAQLAILAERFFALAGTWPPIHGPAGSRAEPTGDPEPATDGEGAGDSAARWRDIRRTEWVAYGLEVVLRDYAGQAPVAGAAVQAAAQALRDWARTARMALR